MASHGPRAPRSDHEQAAGDADEGVVPLGIDVEEREQRDVGAVVFEEPLRWRRPVRRSGRPRSSRDRRSMRGRSPKHRRRRRIGWRAAKPSAECTSSTPEPPANSTARPGSRRRCHRRRPGGALDDLLLDRRLDRRRRIDGVGRGSSTAASSCGSSAATAAGLSSTRSTPGRRQSGPVVGAMRDIGSAIVGQD